ncbi:S8 family serine peptidase [Streptomyces sp. NPDC057695]|uniref:S8 family serine peptidase n=1 Tax=unclassified Streptomyces TaxID=2593676 RepID=UPI0036314142
MRTSAFLRLPVLAVTVGALVAGGVATSLAAPVERSAPSSASVPPAFLSAPSDAEPVTRLIVGYKPQAGEASSDSAAEKDTEAKEDSIGQALDFERRLGTGAALVSLGEGLDPAVLAAVAEVFSSDPDVAYVAPDLMLHATAAKPNDTKYGDQWDLFDSSAGMNVPDAWNKATGNGVNVAVLDTGYAAHSDLSANVISGYDFLSDTWTANDGDGRDNDPADPGDWMKAGDCGTDSKGRPVPARDENSSWHGTHVAGTIAAVKDNKKGTVGIAHGAKIQPVRVLGRCGGPTSDIIDAITWASGGTVQGVTDNPNPAEVINMSLGERIGCGTAMQTAIDAAVKRGSVVVAAAGNDNEDVSQHMPSNCAGVIAVASSDKNGDRSSFSNYGTGVDITAPGSDILSSWNTGTTGPDTTDAYNTMSGTSMATPHVAALAALTIEENPALTPAEVEAVIKKKARKLPGTCTGGCGKGLADATATLGVLYGNGADVSIPDTRTPVTSSLTVDRTGYAPTALRVNVKLKHSYRGDLVIDLVTPGGSSIRLKDSDNNSSDDLTATYTANASGSTAKGTWKLRVTDAEKGDTGRIDAWGLVF